MAHGHQEEDQGIIRTKVKDTKPNHSSIIRVTTLRTLLKVNLCLWAARFPCLLQVSTILKLLPTIHYRLSQASLSLRLSSNRTIILSSSNSLHLRWAEVHSTARALLSRVLAFIYQVWHR